MCWRRMAARPGGAPSVVEWIAELVEIVGFLSVKAKGESGIETEERWEVVGEIEFRLGRVRRVVKAVERE